MKILLMVLLVLMMPFGSAHAAIIIENSPSYAESEATCLLWLADIGITGDQVQYTVDFETGFTAGQNVSGVAGLFPGGMIITDTGSAHSAKVQSSSSYFGNANPIGSYALAHNESAYLELDFSANPVDYVSFRDIDHTGTAVIVHFVGDTIVNTSFETTYGGGDNAEFFGIFRNDMPRITRVQLNATGDGKWGIDDIKYGVIPDDFTISAFVNLGNYSGLLEGVPVTIDLLNEDGSSILRTVNTTLDTEGKFYVSGVRPGRYKVGIKPSHWLRKVTGPIEVVDSDVEFVIQ